MEKQPMTQAEIDALMDRIEANATLNRLFTQLFALYGAPKWLTERKPFQDPEVLIEAWEKLIGEYDEVDIMEASNRLFKFCKLSTFPTAAHILAEIPPETERKTSKKPQPAIVPVSKPAELVPVWNRATLFGIAIGMFNSIVDSVQKEAEKIARQISPGCRIWAEAQARRAVRACDNVRMHDIYGDDPQVMFIACYKNGYLDDIIAKVKANIRGEWEPPKPGDEKKPKRAAEIEAKATTMEAIDEILADVMNG